MLEFWIDPQHARIEVRSASRYYRQTDGADLLPPADNNAYISHMTNFIRTHLEEPFTVQELADYMNLNRSYVTTLFKRYLHCSPHEYIQNCRLTKARHLLETTTFSVESIACSCGYAKSDSFQRAFLRKAGMTPTAYRRQQQRSYLQATDITRITRTKKS